MRQKTAETNFTEGKIVGPLLKFAVPVMFALLLQAMYGAVDMLVVGRFAESVDVSAVATGSQILHTLTVLITGLAMGITIVLGQQIGRGEGKKGGETIGSGIVFFLIVGGILTVLMVLLAEPFSGLMNAPEEAFSRTVSYVRICGAGSIVITAYNLIGSIFRGIGDSKTPLIAVSIACTVNVAGDLLFVAVFRMGAAGAAAATVIAQGVSVVLSLWIIRRRELPFSFSRSDIRFQPKIVRTIFRLGAPVALQDTLVGLSFMIILGIINSLGLTASAGVGVAVKISNFIMLVPSAFMQSMSAFVAQNVGAGKYRRARTTLWSGIAVSFLFGLIMFCLSWFQGTALAGIFTSDPDVVLAAAQYLKAYAIDCLLTAFSFCFVGYFNGFGMTRFVMIQGLAGAFLLRAPLSLYFSGIQPLSLFRIGLAIPIATAIQIGMFFVFMFWMEKKRNKEIANPAESRRFTASMVCNLAVLVSGIIGICIAFAGKGPEIFTKYTNDSSLLAAAVSAVYVVCGIRMLKRGGETVGAAVYCLRFMAVLALMVTLLVVIGGACTGFGIERGFYRAFISGSSLPLHLINPLVSLVSFLFFEEPVRFRARHCFFACIPVFAYAAVSTTLNLLGIWHGPYPFLYVYEQPAAFSVLWAVLINGGAVVLAFLLRYWKSRSFRKIIKN